jgi:penicillin-binding protein 1A
MARNALRNGLDALARRQRISPRVASLKQVQALEYKRRQEESLKDRPLLPGQEIAALVTGIELSKENPGLLMSIGSEKAFLPHEEIKWILGNRKLDQYFAVDDLIMVRLLAKDEASGWKLTSAPPPDLQGGLVLMENKTGAVRAIIGGRDFGQSQFNRAIQARRQPGSSFKPFVYTAALDNGYTEASVIYDAPTSYPQSGGRVWQPKTYSGKFSGPMTLYDALRTSTNVVAVKVGEAIGPETVAAYAKKMGISSPLNPTLSLSLGASEVTLLEITRAYTTFPNLGSWVTPIFIDRVLDRNGQVIKRYEPILTEAISPQTAYIMIDMLVGVANRGTAARVGSTLRIPIGGKTGTTNDQADALFIGFTPEYTCGVWVGRDLRISLGPGEQGGRSASPIFIEFMKNFLADKETGKFQVPKGVVRQSLDEMAFNDMGEPIGGQSFVFKTNEIGRGRIDEKAAEEEAASGPLDFSTMSQEELDRRLLEYLEDYERRRGAVGPF